MSVKKTLLLLIFNLPLFLFSAEFTFLHSSSLTFRDRVPHIRVHVREHSGPLSLGGKNKIKCDGKPVETENAEVTLTKTVPGKVRYVVSLEEIARESIKEYRSRLDFWKKRTGGDVRVFVTGGVFSINNRKIDNREFHIAVKGDLDIKDAGRLMMRYRHRFMDSSINLIKVMEKPTGGEFQVEWKENKITCTDFLEIETSANDHDIEGESFPGRLTLYLTPKKGGNIDLVAQSDVESLLEQILPGEMFLSAPLETLKAQAITARTDIFMQLGKRHTTEPFHICSTVHCQKVLWNRKAEPKFKKAVSSTRGEILLHKSLYVVRAPYSSSCGGHTEDVRHVWFTAKKPYLQGVWDGDHDLSLDLTNESDVKKFLSDSYGECNVKLNRRHRWEKRIGKEKMSTLLLKKNVGELLAIEPLRRGVSGRIYRIRLRGTKRSVTIHGELVIRRLLDNLNSSLFLVEKEGDEWVFRGAGWGHGVGMCQMGAIGMGRKGFDCRAILKRYYPGTVVESIY